MADQIVVYSTARCPNCKILKAFLKEEGINFVEKNLENDDVMTDLVMKNIAVQTAPVLEISGLFFEFRGNAT